MTLVDTQKILDRLHTKDGWEHATPVEKKLYFDMLSVYFFWVAVGLLWWYKTPPARSVDEVIQRCFIGLGVAGGLRVGFELGYHIGRTINLPDVIVKMMEVLAMGGMVAMGTCSGKIYAFVERKAWSGITYMYNRVCEAFHSEQQPAPPANNHPAARPGGPRF